jgi:transposase
MESTGVYWIPLYEILEERGFEVVLVNARDVHNVPGRKSDVQDCEWLRELHSVGAVGVVRNFVSEPVVNERSSCVKQLLTAI